MSLLATSKLVKENSLLHNGAKWETPIPLYLFSTGCDYVSYFESMVIMPEGLHETLIHNRTSDTWSFIWLVGMCNFKKHFAAFISCMGMSPSCFYIHVHVTPSILPFHPKKSMKFDIRKSERLLFTESLWRRESSFLYIPLMPLAMVMLSEPDLHGGTGRYE